MIYSDLIAINQSISALKGHAIEINSTLLSIREALDDFRAACSDDSDPAICRAIIPRDVLHSGLDAVRRMLFSLSLLITLFLKLANPVNFMSALNGLNLNDTRRRFSNPSQILTNVSRVAANYFSDYS